MFFRIVCVVGIAGVFWGLGARADDKALDAEVKKFEGIWEMTECITDGSQQTRDELKGARLVVKGDTFKNEADGKIVGSGSWKFAARKGKVLHIDLTLGGALISRR